MRYRNRIVSLFSLMASAGLAAQAPIALHIDASHPTVEVSPMLYGLMTEEINHSYDGGLYAEMVRNREFARSWAGFEHWYLHSEGSARASISASSDGPSSALPHSARLTITTASAGNEAGLENHGWWGMAVRPSTEYRGSLYAKAEGLSQLKIRILSDEDGSLLASTTVALREGGWQQYKFTMKSSAQAHPSAANHLVLSFDHPGSICLQLVSLFPPTYNARENGNRPDLMKMITAMHPHFLRLPGGNYLEGDSIEERFNWKRTIGPLVDRPTHRGPWGYQSSDGLGLLEFLEWCEDLKIEPVLAVYAGFSLHGQHVLGEELRPFVQEALDELEYVTGGAETNWGAIRARDGHPAPFALRYVEIGNEDDLDKSKSYDDRFAQLGSAIRERYPKLKLIATTRVSKGDPDLIDDHFYRSPEEFFAMVHHYDTMSRTGPKIFVGEWATRIGAPTPNFAAALGDAAWMTGMERNSDLVVMSSYAPLLTNVNPGGLQWDTDLIGYDALRAYGSPSYWAQVLFAQHIGDHVVQSSADHDNDRFFWSATESGTQGLLYLKLVNASDRALPISVLLKGTKRGTAQVESLHGTTWWQTNSIDHPDVIRPRHSTVEMTTGKWQHTIPANTIEVLDIPLR